MYMMEGLDASFDAVFFVSYHGSMGSDASTLSHTYYPAAIAEVTINGAVAGESGVNALVALAHGVPVVLVTGASGFIGSAVVRALLRDGYRVRALCERFPLYDPLM